MIFWAPSHLFWPNEDMCFLLHCFQKFDLLGSLSHLFWPNGYLGKSLFLNNSICFGFGFLSSLKVYTFGHIFGAIFYVFFSDIKNSLVSVFILTIVVKILIFWALFHLFWPIHCFEFCICAFAPLLPKI